MKSSGAGPRIANSSFNVSCHVFNVRSTPCVNGLATGNSGIWKYLLSIRGIVGIVVGDCTLHFDACDCDKVLQLILGDTENGSAHYQP